MARVTNQQVMKLREEMAKHGSAGLASMRSGMHRNTGRKYLKTDQLPSDLKVPRNWRTRPDPFIEDWPAIEQRLVDAPEFEARILFEDLMRRRPGVYDEGQLRTFQRRVKVWRAHHGPDKEVFFPQNHRPGEALQTDFTWATELEVTIDGEPFPHLLCHVVLPYSNWGWVTVCLSESMLALRRGVPAALIQLGRVPQFHQTDNSTAATHEIAAADEAEDASGKSPSHHQRAFNAEYLHLMEHYDMKPRTIGIGKSEQNGDVEALNGALKRRLKQHLLLRGSRDFLTVGDWESWAQGICRTVNERRPRVAEELAAMRSLRIEAFQEFDEIRTRVSPESTIMVKRNTYSVPARLIGEQVLVRLYEMRLEVWHSGKCVLEMPRLVGRRNHHIDYRHVIDSLLRKPGAFARFRHKEDLFPSPVWHLALDAMAKSLGERKGEVAFMRLLHLASKTMECDVEAALVLLLESGEIPEPERVKDLMGIDKPTQAPLVAPLVVNLKDFDSLLDFAVAEVV
ncbi:MAG: IS21 family transposase [Deltaproteobacteria bacterium]